MTHDSSCVSTFIIFFLGGGGLRALSDIAF